MPKQTKVTVDEVDSDVVEQTENLEHNFEVSEGDVEKITFPAVADKYSNDESYNVFPKYQYDDKEDYIIFQTKPIEITRGGIPQLDAKHRPTDAKREFFWLGWDKEQPACNELFEFLKKVDNKFEPLIEKNEKTNTLYEMHGNKKVPVPHLSYTRLVRKSVKGGGAKPKEGEKAYTPYDRIKVKFSTIWDPNAPKDAPHEIDTKLFVGNEDEPRDIKSVTDMEKVLKYKSTAIFVFGIYKFKFLSRFIVLKCVFDSLNQ